MVQSTANGGTVQASNELDRFNLSEGAQTVEEVLLSTARRLTQGGKSILSNDADSQVVEPGALPAIKPGHTPPTPGDKHLVVSISPNSRTAGAATSNLPEVLTIGTTFVTALAANDNRQSFILQNNGATNLFLVFMRSTPAQNATTNYHIKLIPGQAATSDMWKGQIDVISNATGGILAVLGDDAVIGNSSTRIEGPNTQASTNPNAADASSQIATDAFVQAAIALSMGTVQLVITGGTYSFAGNGTGGKLNFTAVGGVITSIVVWIPIGSGYAAGDLISPQGGNNDAYIVITAVNGLGQPTSGTILYGGTGYVSGTDNAIQVISSIPFTFLLTGALTSDANFVMTGGTRQTQSNQWIFCNNTTGAHNVTVAVATPGTDTPSGGRTVTVPQGVNNSRSVFLQTDGVLNVDIAGVVSIADATAGALANGTTATKQAALSNDTKVATDSYVDSAVAAVLPLSAIPAGLSIPVCISRQGAATNPGADTTEDIVFTATITAAIAALITKDSVFELDWEIESAASMTGTFIVRVRIGGIGGTVISSDAGLSTSRHLRYLLFIHNRGADVSHQISWEVNLNGNTLVSTAAVPSAINTGAAFTIVLTLQLTSALDQANVTLNCAKCILYP